MTTEKNNRTNDNNRVVRLGEFYKKPINEIYVESTQEIEVGIPVGKEVW